jgi:hypothetical protein
LDLYHNALRRKKGGQYADVISVIGGCMKEFAIIFAEEKLG